MRIFTNNNKRIFGIMDFKTLTGGIYENYIFWTLGFFA